MDEANLKFERFKEYVFGLIEKYEIDAQPNYIIALKCCPLNLFLAGLEQHKEWTIDQLAFHLLKKTASATYLRDKFMGRYIYEVIDGRDHWLLTRYVIYFREFLEFQSKMTSSVG